MSEVSVSETEAENQCEDRNIVKKIQATLGIEPAQFLVNIILCKAMQAN